MNTEAQEIIIRKIISQAIGLCSSMQPEKKAVAVLEALLEKYDIIPKLGK